MSSTSMFSIRISKSLLLFCLVGTLIPGFTDAFVSPIISRPTFLKRHSSTLSFYAPKRYMTRHPPMTMNVLDADHQQQEQQDEEDDDDETIQKAIQANRRRMKTRRDKLRAQQQKSSQSSSSSSQYHGDHDYYTNDQEWKFFDTARVHVSGGDGGNGCVAFRREKGEPLGGPSGGRGGHGGSVYLECDKNLNTLAPLRRRVHVFATKGKNGIGKNKDGQKGKSIVIPVPPGTVVRELHTQKIAGELRDHGDRLLVARGGRGGRGNRAFMTDRLTAPRIAERGEPGVQRWLAVELKLVADVGFLGKPNAGKSTLLASSSAAKPKIASYPFTTIIPNLGVCDIGEEGAGLVFCDIPGLIEGAAQGAGLGPTFLRHVQRCRVLLHVIDGASEDPIGDFHTINKELKEYDELLADKPQVVVLNKLDIPAVQEREQELLEKLREAAGHTRVLSISAAKKTNVKQLMGRLKKFVDAQPIVDLPPIPEIDLAKAGLDIESDDFEVVSDPSYPGQWRVSGQYIESIAKMTHWEYPEAVARFGRQLDAIGIGNELKNRGAVDGDLIMVGPYDFEFNPTMSNPYIPKHLLEMEAKLEGRLHSTSDDELEEEEPAWQPFNEGGYLNADPDELAGFAETDEWDLLEDDDHSGNSYGDEEYFDDGDDDGWSSSDD